MCNENNCVRAVAVSDEQPRRHTAMTPTQNAEPTTQAERLVWPVHREAMMNVAYRYGAFPGPAMSEMSQTTNPS